MRHRSLPALPLCGTQLAQRKAQVANEGKSVGTAGAAAINKLAAAAAKSVSTLLTEKLDKVDGQIASVQAAAAEAQEGASGKVARAPSALPWTVMSVRWLRTLNRYYSSCHCPGRNPPPPFPHTRFLCCCNGVFVTGQIGHMNVSARCHERCLAPPPAVPMQWLLCLLPVVCFLGWQVPRR